MLLNASSWVCTDVHEMQLFFWSVYGMESKLKSPLQDQQLQAQKAPFHAPRSAGHPPRTEAGRAPAAIPRGAASPWEPFPRGGHLGLNRPLGCSQSPPAGHPERGRSQEPSPVGRVPRSARHCPLHHEASRTSPPETPLSLRCITCARLRGRGVGRGRLAKSVTAQVLASKSLGSNSATM